MAAGLTRDITREAVKFSFDSVEEIAEEIRMCRNSSLFVAAELVLTMSTAVLVNPH